MIKLSSDRRVFEKIARVGYRALLGLPFCRESGRKKTKGITKTTGVKGTEDKAGKTEKVKEGKELPFDDVKVVFKFYENAIVYLKVISVSNFVYGKTKLKDKAFYIEKSRISPIQINEGYPILKVLFEEKRGEARIVVVRTKLSNEVSRVVPVLSAFITKLGVDRKKEDLKNVFHRMFKPKSKSRVKVGISQHSRRE